MSDTGIFTYNIQGWDTRAFEAMNLVFKTESSICVFTEVGELWNSFKIPHFISFYQKGTNRSEGVMVVIGKHLRATRIDLDLQNTVTVNVVSLSVSYIIKQHHCFFVNGRSKIT
jgi:hypothetical protein